MQQLPVVAPISRNPNSKRKNNLRSNKREKAKSPNKQQQLVVEQQVKMPANNIKQVSNMPKNRTSVNGTPR